MANFWERLMVARQAFLQPELYGQLRDRTTDKAEQRYALLGAMYTGTWVMDPRWPWHLAPSSLYNNARQIVKSTGAIVDCYDQLTYAGDLSSDGKPLPDGTRGAIPIDPQTGKAGADEALITAFHELFKMWQWRSYMSLPVRTAAIFGDCFVELIDDFQHGTVYPNIVYPGYIPDKDLELDAAGNVQQYAMEYRVEIPESSAFGRKVERESYMYRKEVDKEVFRYYKDGKPFDYYGPGSRVQENVYGFVPACLFRHEITVGSKRGIGAFERTVVQALELNSTLSSATDYQRKKFGAPVGVRGRVSGAVNVGGVQTLTMPGGVLPGNTLTIEDYEAARNAAADQFPLLPLSPDGGFVTIEFDLGQTMTMVEFIQSNLVEENPESKWASKLFELQNPTGPGVQKTLAPIIGKVEAARRNHDPQMVKLPQMATSMMGMRLKRGDIPLEVRNARPARFKVFEAFDLTSYGRGLLDATIPNRPVFTESRFETAQWLTLAAGLPEWGLAMLGITPEERAAAQLEAEKAQQELDAELTGIGIEPQGPTGPTGGATGRTGPTGPTGARG